MFVLVFVKFTTNLNRCFECICVILQSAKWNIHSNMAHCPVILENDTREWVLTANIIIQCVIPACIKIKGIHFTTQRPPHPPESHKHCRVLLLYLLGWVCSLSTRRRMMGVGKSRGGGACSSWRVAFICIWHTDCTKYANRQTMTFAVLFFLWYCSLSAK